MKTYKEAKKVAETRKGWYIVESDNGDRLDWKLFSKTGKYANAWGIERSKKNIA